MTSILLQSLRLIEGFHLNFLNQADPIGIEPTTFASTGRCSIQLSYESNVLKSGTDWIRTNKAVKQMIYSHPVITIPPAAPIFALCVFMRRTTPTLVGKISKNQKISSLRTKKILQTSDSVKHFSQKIQKIEKRYVHPDNFYRHPPCYPIECLFQQTFL